MLNTSYMLLLLLLLCDVHIVYDDISALVLNNCKI
jgi:hypothetical protein